MNIVDTLTAGFTTVTKKPWLGAVPVVLDLFLWLGPKLSIAPVIQKMIASFREAMAIMASSGGQDANLQIMFERMLEELQGTFAQTNWLSLLAWGRLGLPSIASSKPIVPGVDRVIEISGYQQLLATQILIMALGLFIACIFLGILAQEIRGESFDLGKLARRVPLYWWRMALIFLPLSIALFLLFSASFLFGAFAFFIWVSILWALLYLSFVPQAITLAETKPLSAVWTSFAVVRHNFWSALGLILLSNLIATGLGLILRNLLGSVPGTLVAILANAYVGTGLAAAAFVFYRDRLTAWRDSQRNLRSV